MKKLMRDSLSDICIIICFSIACLIILYFMPSIVEIREINSDSNYNYNMGILIQNLDVDVDTGELKSKNFDEVLAFIDEIDTCNIYVRCQQAVNRNMNVDTCILYKSNEDIIVDGIWNDKTFSCIISDTLDYKKQIDFNGVELKVDGQYTYYNLNGLRSDRVLINYNQLTEYKQNELKNQFSQILNHYDIICLNICSRNKCEDVTKNLAEKINTLGYYTEWSEIENTSIQDADLKKFEKYAFYGSIALTIAALLVASTLWTSRRKKEFAIRKAFGFSNRKIAFFMILDIVKLAVISLVITGISYVIFIHNSSLHYKHILISFGGLMCACLISFIRSYILVEKIQPVNGISKG